ncbi:MAG: PA14 domain-containing protein, partial [Planctomycetota bacterium]
MNKNADICVHPRSSAVPQKPGAAAAIKVPAPVAEALTRFAEVNRRLALWEAAGWVLAALILAFTLIALADRFLFVGGSVRRFEALAGYLLCLLLAAPFLKRAFRRRSPAEIARALELRAPGAGLAERVSTTVELAGRSLAGEGVSQQMVERVADESAQLVGQLSIAALPDRTRARRSGKTGLAALAAVLLLCLVPGLHFYSFYLRALLPWGRFHRPSNTAVAVSPGDTRVVDGTDLEIAARLDGRLVQEVWLESRERDTSSWTRLAMDPETEQPQRFTLKVGPLRVPLEYRVRAGDFLSDEYTVALLPRPEISGLKFVVNYPAYTGMAPETIERLNGDLAVLKGARIEVLLRTNTALAAAVLDFAGGRKISLAVNGGSATGTFDVLEDTQYRVLLRSNEGVENPEAPLFSIHAIPDRPPQVAVLKPSADETIDAGQLLNLEARAEDDLGLVSCRLVVRTDMRPGPSVLKLQRPPESGKVWLIVQPWDLAGMFLQDGETVFYQVEAVDSAGQVGRSDERRLRVASGRKRESAQVLAALENAQRLLSSAHRLLTGARKDIVEMRQFFRPQDVEFQSAERLLLTDTFRRVGSEAQAAGAALEKVAPQAEAGPLRLLLAALHNALQRFGDTGLRPLVGQAFSLSPQAGKPALQVGRAVAAGLDVLSTLAPAAESRLFNLHQAVTAAQRYSGATLLAERAADVRDAQAPITPVLVGAAAWSARGAYTPGLLAEYYRGQNFEQLARRTVECKLEHKNEDLPEVGRNSFSIRWRGEVLAPQAGRYVFRATANDGVRLTVAGKCLIDEWRAQAAAPQEGAIELAEGWHEIVCAFFHGRGEYEFSLTRSGPRTPDGPLPPEQLRNAGAPALSAGDDVRAAMAVAASAPAVQQALLRLHTMIQAAAGLAPELTRLASLPPERDSQGQKD